MVDWKIEKDFAIKPLVCTITFAIGIYYSVKVTYNSAAVTYNTMIKPALKAWSDNRRKI